MLKQLIIGIMKKTLFLLCLFLTLSVSGTWAGDETVKPVEIAKGQIVDPNEVRPRTPVIIPITCVYVKG